MSARTGSARFVQWRSALRVGVLAARSRDTAGGLLLVAAVTAVLGALIAALIAGPQMMHAQALERRALAWNSGDTATGLMAFKTMLAWKDEFVVVKIALAVDPSFSGSAPKPPPGLPRVPVAGEVWASPALIAAARTDPDLQPLFKDVAVQSIPDEGLVTPATMLLYQGQRSADLVALRVPPTARFGGDSEFGEEEQGLDPILLSLAWVSLFLFAVLPCLLLLRAATDRLLARRGSRLARLEFIGMSRAPSRLATCLDGILAAAIGALLGAVTIFLILRFGQKVVGVPASWWGRQAPNGVSTIALSTLLAAGAATAALVLRPAGAATELRTSSLGGARPPRSLRLLPLPVGIGVALLTQDWRVDGSPQNMATVVGALVLIVVGVPLALPWIIDRVGRLMITRSPVAWTLAGARLVRGQSSTRRSGVVLASAVLLATAVTPLIAQAAPRDTLTAGFNQQLGRVALTFNGIAPGTDLRNLSPAPIAVTAAEPRGNDTVYQFPCDALQRFSGTPNACSPSGQMTLESMGTPVILPVQALDLGTRFTEGPVTNIIAPPRPDDDPMGVQALAIVSTPDEVWPLIAATATLPGAASASANIGGLLGGADQLYTQLQQWLRLALLGLLTATACALLIGLSEDAHARRSTDSALIVIGATNTATVRAHRLEILVRVGLTCLLSAGAALILNQVSASWVGAQTPPALWMASLFGALFLTLTVALTLGPQLSRIGQPLEELRKD